MGLKNLCIAVMTVAITGWSIFVGPAVSQMGLAGSQTGEKKESDKPSATVKIEIQEGAGKKPEVKVNVEGGKVEVNSTKQKKEKEKEKEGGAKAPEEKIVPVETEKIDRAMENVSTRLEEGIEAASKRVASWVSATAVYEIPWVRLILSVVILFLVLLLQGILSRLMQRQRLKIRQEERSPTWPEVIIEAMYKPLCLFLWVYGVYAALALLFPYFQRPQGTNILKESAKHGADVGSLIALIWFVWRSIRLVDIELEKRAKSPESRVDDLEAALIGKTLRWVIIISGAVLVFQYLTGVSAAPIIASLGIGGLAIALAAKDSISNLFGTITIMFDQPFKVGDRIKIDGFDGFVETVGYRSTRLRLWNGNQVTVPNYKIISSNVENFARRPHMWWKTNITLTYDTPPDKVDKAVEIIDEIIRRDPETSRTWLPWVFFDGFNDWSLNVRVLAWFSPPGKEPGQLDYYTWRQRICRQVLRKFEQEGIQFAFPTQTTYLAGDDRRELQIRMIAGQGPDATEERQ